MLKELRIDRSQEEAPTGRGKWLAIGAVVVLAAAGAGWFAFGRGNLWSVKTATAQAAGTAQAGSTSVLDASGYVTARRQATVSSKITGRVSEVLIEEGQRVEAGQVLARLDPVDAQAQMDMSTAQLEAARAMLAELNVQLVQAQRDEKRQADLVQRKLTSQQAADDARSQAKAISARLTAQERQVNVAQRGVGMSRVQLDNTVVTAPFAGVITVKAAQPGEIVSPMSAGGGFTRTGIGTVVDMNSLEIEVDVNEAYIGRVQANQPVESTLNAYPDWKLPGKVIAIIPTADRSKATVKVRIGIDTKDARIVPDMGARVAFLEDTKPVTATPVVVPGVLVPGEALVAAGDTTVVYVVANGKAQQRKVTAGKVMGAQRQLTTGLAIGERVVLAPPAEMKDGDRVTTE
ncbi:MAG: efflux RND transporter periplasmic adaptor subunit [Tahibacter sp.]